MAFSSTPGAPGVFLPALCGKTRVGLMCSLEVESVCKSKLQPVFLSRFWKKRNRFPKGKQNQETMSPILCVRGIMFMSV